MLRAGSLHAPTAQSASQMGKLPLYTPPKHDKDTLSQNAEQEIDL